MTMATYLRPDALGFDGTTSLEQIIEKYVADYPGAKPPTEQELAKMLNNLKIPNRIPAGIAIELNTLLEHVVGALAEHFNPQTLAKRIRNRLIGALTPDYRLYSNDAPLRDQALLVAIFALIAIFLILVVGSAGLAVDGFAGGGGGGNSGNSGGSPGSPVRFGDCPSGYGWYDQSGSWVCAP